MARSFLQRLLGKRNRGFEARPSAETPTSRAPDQEHLKSEQARSEIQNFQPTTKVNSLFAFVDLQDPISPGVNGSFKTTNAKRELTFVVGWKFCISERAC